MAHRLLQSPKEAHGVTSTSVKKKTQQRCLSWGMLLSIAVYFLNLCTLSPRVHAETLRHTIQTKHLTAGHCSTPATAPQTAAPSSADQERKTTPLCCDLRGMHNRATSDSPTQADIAPLHVCSLFLLDLVSGKEQLVHILQAQYYSHSPPLYLLHAALLI